MTTSIATLRAGAGEHPAFPYEEHAARLARAQAAMAAEGVDALVLSDPQSLAYFTGYRSVNLWDFSALTIPAAGMPIVVLWDFEAARFEVSANLGRLVTYAAGDDPVAALVAVVAEVAPAVWAADDWAVSAASGGLRAVERRLADADRRDARPILWRTRLVKSPAELALLRHSAALTDAGIGAAYDALAVGASDHELAAASAAAMLRGGSGHFAIQPIVAVGARAGIPHSEVAGARVRPGEGVFVELGASVAGYTAPLMRTLVAGEPEPALRDLEALAQRAVAAALEAMRPGVTAAAVATAVEDEVARGGDDVLFHHGVGYPVGQSAPPTWIESLDFLVRRDNPEPLAQGMVFHLPMSLRHRGRRGVGLSQTVEVTAGGGQVMSSLPAQLWIKET